MSNYSNWQPGQTSLLEFRTALKDAVGQRSQAIVAFFQWELNQALYKAACAAGADSPRKATIKLQLTEDSYTSPTVLSTASKTADIIAGKKVKARICYFNEEEQKMEQLEVRPQTLQQVTALVNGCLKGSGTHHHVPYDALMEALDKEIAAKARHLTFRR